MLHSASPGFCASPCKPGQPPPAPSETSQRDVVKVLCNTQRRTASECHLVRPLAEPDGGLGPPGCQARIFVSMEGPGPEDSRGHAHEALTASARGRQWGTNPSRACPGGCGRSYGQGGGPSGMGSCRG